MFSALFQSSGDREGQPISIPCCLAALALSTADDKLYNAASSGGNFSLSKDVVSGGISLIADAVFLQDIITSDSSNNKNTPTFFIKKPTLIIIIVSSAQVNLSFYRYRP